MQTARDALAKEATLIVLNCKGVIRLLKNLSSFMGNEPMYKYTLILNLYSIHSELLLAIRLFQAVPNLIRLLKILGVLKKPFTQLYNVLFGRTRFPTHDVWWPLLKQRQHLCEQGDSCPGISEFAKRCMAKSSRFAWLVRISNFKWRVFFHEEIFWISSISMDIHNNLFD